MSIVQTSTFRLAAGVTDEAFLALDRRVQRELIPNQPGFMRRTTARRGDQWMVVTLWASEEAAAAFDAVAATDPIQTEFDAALQADSVQTARFDTLD